VALDLLSPLQTDGALRKSKNVSHLKASNRRSKERVILLRNKDESHQNHAVRQFYRNRQTGAVEIIARGSIG
jgi:hypothetical protein